ncbi:FAD/NAD(P)-binding protein [Helicobacter sp. T3_23-1056]
MSKIAIIGFGARGLSIFERFISKILANNITRKIDVYIFDPHSLGSGCHKITQSSRLLANTVASQMSIFADETICKNEFFIKGPNFYDFLLMKGYKAQKNGYYARSLLGEYLEYSFLFVRGLCPNNVTLHIIKEKAQSVSKQKSNFVITSKNTQIEVNAIFITTGHPEQTSDLNEVSAYPTDIATANLSHKDTVAIKGLGLSAIDLITLLTSGYGGHYETINDELVYFPSGKEPKILAFSRSNLPLMARAITQKEVREQYQPLFFTTKKINKLLQNGLKLDFEKEVLPLIIKEMEYVYSYTYIATYQSIEDSFTFKNQYILLKNQRELIDKYIPKKFQFDFQKLINPIGTSKNANEFRNKIIEYLEQDIKEASLGNLTSPIKAACDVLRDVRDILRLCIDFGGLSEESYNFFIKFFVPLNNRLCVGPPLIKIKELLALIKVGNVEILSSARTQCANNNKIKLIDSFSNTYQVDRLINARIDSLSIKDDDLLSSLICNGLATKFKNGSLEFECLQIDSNFQSVTKNNKTIKNLFILGLPTEGIKFYTFILPRPFIASTFLNDSDKAITTLIKNLGF